MAMGSLAFRGTPVYVRYEPDVEEAITRLSGAIAQVPDLRAQYNPRWLAVQLLEEDATLLAEVERVPGGVAVVQVLQECAALLRAAYDEDVDVVLTDQRYRFVNGLVRNVLTRPAEQHLTLSDRIDRIVTHRWLGIPIFLALMWIVFKITADVTAPFVDWVDGVIQGPIANWIVALLGVAGLGGTWIERLAVDGIIAGVGGVLVFVPVLMALYFALALLEDSGYMARAAFVMDRLMRGLGLHGKSFLPMIVGFGCNVPAIYATRTLENEKDRILTGLLVPFMSCSARLPVYVLLAAIFFPQSAGVVIFSLYLLGILMAILVGVAFKHTLFKGKEQVPFIMELPPYRLPTLKSIWFHMWERTAAFVRKAWTIILATSVVVWFLMALPTNREGTFAEIDVNTSAFATVSQGISPLFTPLGFGSWESSGALVSGFVAKEVVVSTMTQLHNVDEAEEAAAPTTFLEDIGTIGTSFVDATVDALKAIPLIVGIDLLGDEEEAEPTSLMLAVQTNFAESSGGHAALAALAFMVFVLLYTPCMVTVAATRHELGSKWMWFSIGGQFALAWVVALVVFQGGLLLGLG